MIPLDKVLAWMVLAVGLLAVIFGALVQRDNHTQTDTIAELTQQNTYLLYLLGPKYDSLLARQDSMMALFMEGEAILLHGTPRAFVELLGRETDK